MSAARGRSARKPGARSLEGEGSYSATRDYNRHLERDLKSRDVGQSATRARRALEGPEARELREAEEKGKRGPKSELQDEDKLPISDPLR
ncbi:MAG TPA: hypothetical protein VHO25_13490 [Polyangiaceae bacterium]|nr:hypothetical protein [Polyangiaceae bacterium]